MNPAVAVPTAKENPESVFKVEPLALEVGLGLVKLVEGGRNSQPLRRIAGIRKQMASDASFMVPPVRVTDNLQLKAGEYFVLLERRGDRALRTGAELRARHSHRRRVRYGSHAARRGDARTGVRNPSGVDSCGDG